MKNFIQKGDVLTLTPSAAVASGVGFLFGTLFGVATSDVVISTPGEFRVRGVVDIGKTAAVAVSVGARVFWDPVGKVVNTTAVAQQCVGVAVETVAGTATTVKILLGSNVPVAT